MEDMAEHAEKVNDYLIKNLNLTQFECDEFWTTIKKNRRRLSELARLNLKKVMPMSIRA